MKFTYSPRRLFSFVLISCLLLTSNALSAMALTAISISPATGPIGGGNLVTIKGNGFMTTETERFADVEAGVVHAVMLSRNGHVWTVGRNGEGQLGISSLDKYKITPQDITKFFNLDSSDRIISISSGDYYSFAISDKHRIFAWGQNTYGQLADGSRNNQTKPVEITGNFSLDAGDYITKIVANNNISYAVSNNGQVFVWGDRSKHRDGRETETFAPATKPVLANDWMTDGITQISLGLNTGIAYNSNGLLLTWGNNSNGELGLSGQGMDNFVGSPRAMAVITDKLGMVDGDRITDVAAGNGVMAVLTRYHHVYVWGSDRQLMLGLDGEKPNPNDSQTGDQLSSAPIDITDRFHLAADDCISQISVGNSHVLAVSQYGQVFAWGQADYGQLGLGDNISQPGVTNTTAMFNLPEGTTIQKVIAAGDGDNALASYSYALDSDGVVYAWGGSKEGWPGINIVANTNRPGAISDRLSADVSDIASIKFGEVEATKFNVLGDETIKVVVPQTDVAGPVPITVTDRAGDSVVIEQQYNYRSLDENDNQNGHDDEDADQNKPDNNNPQDKDNEKDNAAAQNGSGKDKENEDAVNHVNGSDANGDKASSTKYSGSGAKIAAPNAGL